MYLAYNWLLWTTVASLWQTDKQTDQFT